MAGEITVTETVVQVDATVSPVVVTVTESPVQVTTTNQGIQGATGAQGADGAKGDKGDTGSSGVVSVTAPITNLGTSTAANIGINDATTSVKGAVQLTDSTSSTSITTAATPASVKSAYDLASTANTAAGTKVSSVSGTLPISVTSGTTPTVTIASASTSAAGAVQLTDSTSSTSTTTAATPNSVKTAYDLANGKVSSVSNAPSDTTITIGGTAIAPTVKVNSITSGQVSGLAASATTDTTNASNISSGTLAIARGGTGIVYGSSLVGRVQLMANRTKTNNLSVESVFADTSGNQTFFYAEKDTTYGIEAFVQLQKSVTASVATEYLTLLYWNLGSATVLAEQSASIVCIVAGGTTAQLGVNSQSVANNQVDYGTTATTSRTGYWRINATIRTNATTDGRLSIGMGQTVVGTTTGTLAATRSMMNVYKMGSGDTRSFGNFVS